MGIEIEKKFLVKELPADLTKYPCHRIEQGYLNVAPAIRVRRQDDEYYMTYKSRNSDFSAGTGNGDIVRTEGAGRVEDIGQTEGIVQAGDIGQTEYNLPLDAESYEHLCSKADGHVIRKKRYLIPLNDDAFDSASVLAYPELARALSENSIVIELDVFEAPFEGRILAEVEFPSEAAARAYKPAAWFLEDVTGDRRYSNASMSREEID